MLGRWKEAREQIVAAANLRPNDFFTVEWAGRLLLQNGRNIDGARRYLGRARELGSQVVNSGALLWTKGFPMFELWIHSQPDAAFGQFDGRSENLPAL